MTNSIQEHFNQMAINRDENISTDVILNYEQQLRAKLVLGYLSPAKDEKILEVGCGNGRDLLEIGIAGSQCIGIDISENMLEGAKKQLADNNIKNVEIKYEDVTKLTFPTDSFDKALASEVLEHIPDYKKAISEMSRVLKRGGVMVISTPNWISMHGLDRYFFYNLLGKKDNHPYDKWKSYTVLKNALEENGMNIIEYKSVCFIPGFVIVNRLPLFLKKIIVGLTSLMEPMLQKLFPKNGYIISFKAVKK